MEIYEFASMRETVSETTQTLERASKFYKLKGTDDFTGEPITPPSTTELVAAIDTAVEILRIFERKLKGREK